MVDKTRNRTGEVLDGYNLVKKIGEGSLGHVYLGHHPDLNRQLAFKISVNPFDHKYFAVEAKNMSQLDHPRIIQPVNCCLEGDEVYISMEYIEYAEGINSTGAYVQKRGPFEVDTVVQIARQLLEALIYAHGKKIWHRDIKPNNLLMDPKFNVFVSDFNLATIQEEEQYASMSSSGGGSSPFQSPEQANGEKKLIDARTDIFSLGLTLNYLLTGSIRRTNPVSKRDDVPDGLGALIVDAIHEEYDERIATAQEFLDRLNEVVPRTYATHEQKKIDHFSSQIEQIVQKEEVLTAGEVERLNNLRTTMYSQLAEMGVETPLGEVEQKFVVRWEKDSKQMKQDLQRAQDEERNLQGEARAEMEERILEYISAYKAWEKVEIHAERQ